jgi:secondary thiamine-phosphate synthase enzyme
MKEFGVSSSKRFEVLDITDQVQDLLSPDADGVVMVYCPHTTASVLVGETGEGLIEDYEQMAAKLYCDYGPYLHCGHGDPNAEGHILGLMHGCSVLVPVEAGQLKMGINQKIVFFEGSGPRDNRHVWVKML